jgi:hypothetical protein
MSSEEDTTEIEDVVEKVVKKNPFFSWLKGLGLKIKIFFIALFGIVGTIMFFVFSKKMNTKEILKIELEKVRKEIEIEGAAKEIDKNNEKLLSLEARAEEIKKEILEIEEVTPNENPTEEELDDFFDSRGF